MAPTSSSRSASRWHNYYDNLSIVSRLVNLFRSVWRVKAHQIKRSRRHRIRLGARPPCPYIEQQAASTTNSNSTYHIANTKSDAKTLTLAQGTLCQSFTCPSDIKARRKTSPIGAGTKLGHEGSKATKGGAGGTDRLAGGKLAWPRRCHQSERYQKRYVRPATSRALTLRFRE